jgi:hypothetical protein
MKRDADVLGWTLNDNFAERRMGQFLLEMLAQAFQCGIDAA